MKQLHYTMHSDLSSFLVLFTLMLPGLTFWCVLICFSCVPLVCNLMDCSSLGPSVHGIFQAKILDVFQVALPFSRGASQPRDRLKSLMSPALASGFFTTSTP